MLRIVTPRELQLSKLDLSVANFEIVFSRSGSSNQCCYRANGALIVGSPSGGTVNTVSPEGSLQNKMSHLKEDVLPNEWCCNGEVTRNRCDMFHERRGSVAVLSSPGPGPGPGPGPTTRPTTNPPTTRPTTNPPTTRPTTNPPATTQPPTIIPIIPIIIIPVVIFAFAFFFGDPHMLSLDLMPYTFNGKGEFILLETNDTSFTMQGRMVAALNRDDGEAAATILSAIVAKQRDSPAVQFELLTDSDSNVDLVALVNGIRLDFGVLKSQRFDNVIVSDIGNKTLEASFSNGIFVTLREANGFISMFTVSLPASFQGRTSGLMGNYNGDPSDDFLPRNGSTPLSVNASNKEIHEQFGITCKLFMSIKISV